MPAAVIAFPNPVDEVAARVVAGGVVLLCAAAIALDLPPPKRFAQGIGAVLSATAAVLALGAGQVTAGYAVLGAVAVAAALEAVLGFCVGCRGGQNIAFRS